MRYTLLDSYFVDDEGREAKAGTEVTLVAEQGTIDGKWTVAVDDGTEFDVDPDDLLAVDPE